MCPRKYDSRKRHDLSEATRVRILEAARSLLAGRGDLSEFSVDEVARKANVARMTIYNRFGSRGGLLEALSDRLAMRGGMHRMPEVFLAPTLEEGARRLVGIFTEFWASDPVTMRRLRAMGVAFPSDARGPRDRDAWRREAVQNLLQRHRGRVRPGRRRNPTDLVDTVTALTSFEMYDLLRSESRKTEEVAAIVADLVVLTLRRDE